MTRRATQGLEARVTAPSGLDAGEIAAWLGFMAATPGLGRAFLSPRFALASERAGGRVRVAVLRDAAGPCGFFAFQFASLWHQAFGAAEPVGGALADHAGLVARPGFAIGPDVLLRLCGLGSLFLRQLSPGQAGFGLAAAPAAIGHLIDLSDGPAAYFEALAARDRPFFLDTERRARRVEKEFGRIEHATIRDPPAAAVEGLIAAKRAQYGRTEVADPLAGAEARRLLLLLARDGGPECRVVLGSLSAGGRILARHLGLLHGRTLSYWFPVYDPAARHVSPGRLLLWHTIRSAGEEGIALIDRGGGDSQAKRDFSTGTVQFGAAHYTTRGLRGRLAHAAQGVSVVIPARNAAATLGRAIASAHAQTVAPFEIIVVDDASTDDTAKVAREAGGARLSVIRLHERHGAAAARNHAVHAARGEFVAFLDADDSWDPMKTARQLAVIAARPAMTFCACRARHVAEDGRVLGPIHGGVPVATGEDAWRALLARNFIATPCVLARRQAILAAGGFDPALPVAEDQDLWIRLALAGELGFVDEALVTVHDRPSSLSREYAARSAEITLAMVLGHIARQGSRLTRAERQTALGARHAEAGRRFYRSGERTRGLACLARAILNGHERRANLWYLVTAAPGMAAFKRWIRAAPALRGRPGAGRADDHSHRSGPASGP
jgi:CelD/BcsL family acetyltransferase involved in cellulose biosynthesis